MGLKLNPENVLKEKKSVTAEIEEENGEREEMCLLENDK